jgi:uncharacterized protein HemX
MTGNSFASEAASSFAATILSQEEVYRTANASREGDLESMSTAKKVVVILVATAAVGAAGYSFYSTYMSQPTSSVTAEQREEARRAVAAFSKSPGEKK